MWELMYFLVVLLHTEWPYQFHSNCLIVFSSHAASLRSLWPPTEHPPLYLLRTPKRASDLLLITLAPERQRLKTEREKAGIDGTSAKEKQIDLKRGWPHHQHQLTPFSSASRRPEKHAHTSGLCLCLSSILSTRFTNTLVHTQIHKHAFRDTQQTKAHLH